MLLQSAEINLAAQVSQMALVHIGGQVRVRFWCTRCNTAEQLVESDDAMMRVKKGALSTKSVLASLEHVALPDSWLRTKVIITSLDTSFRYVLLCNIVLCKMLLLYGTWYVSGPMLSIS